MTKSNVSKISRPKGAISILIFLKVRIVLGLALMFSWPLTQASAREIIDMAGRHVDLPEKLEHIYATTALAATVVYAMKPESLVGWSFPVATMAPEDEFPGSRAPSHGMDDHLKDSAYWVNFGQFPDLQADAIVAVINSSTHIGTLETQSANSNAPLIVLHLDSLADYSDAFVLLGRIMGEEARAAKLNIYLKTAISKVRAIIPDQPGYRRVHLYCDDCSTIIEVHHIVLDDGIEFLSNFVILQASNFAHNLHTDRHWHNVKAAAFGRVHSMPNFPFSWIDDQPSLAQVLGIEWLASEFYPQSFPFDLKDDTKRFYRLFLNVNLSDRDVEKILN